ncbi:MAG: phosphate/sulfate permease [Alphaproteobacteria bacterium]|jgi:phosphate/sulfate permease
MFGMIALLGTTAAMLSVIGNDCVQTLSTFIQSCGKRKASAWMMSIFLSTVFVGTLCYGYFVLGDASFGRLAAIPYQEPQVLHLIPLAVLVVLTYIGIPVSTTFIVLSVFSTNAVMLQMIQKSVIGGTMAFTFGFCVWSILVRFFDERKDVIPKKYHSKLIGIQTIATGVLLVAWVMHDVANILVFLPRGTELGNVAFLAICVASCAVLSLIVFASGGRIQKIVANKSGTNYVFSAILIDFFYAFVLFFLKGYSDIPMSTTWAFIGLILGRECAMAVYHDKSLKKFLPIARKDIYKLVLGAAISIIVVEIVQSV